MLQASCVREHDTIAGYERLTKTPPKNSLLVLMLFKRSLCTGLWYHLGFMSEGVALELSRL